MRDLPSGTVSFLFTDVEGSTRRWEQDSPAMLAAVERHFAILDDAIQANNGARYKIIGDAAQAAFPTARDAVLAAVAAQRALAAEDWGSLGPLLVRMAIHTGAATPHDGDYLAPALNRLSRLLAAGSGGQILLTEATRNLLRDDLPGDLQLLDLGEHRLRDLRDPEHVFQLVAEGLSSDFPPLKSQERPRHNLPALLDLFVGRERELAEVRAKLEEPSVRLLTLTGPGGTGKTRLALQIASQLVESYADGVWFVPLATLSDAGLVAATIADTLGVRDDPGEPLEASLRAFLRNRQLLLVLDNFEHVVEAAPLVADLLAHAPSLQVLATSRAPLRITGEHEYPVPPMQVPQGSAVRLDDALASEAVRLFVDRAQTVRPGFTLTEQNVGAVVAICRRLDGLPLAIELAAARVRLLSPDAILARLDSRLSLLTGGGRDLPERQQTLRAAIAWSHDLLDEEEQALFRRLSVFVGGWTLEAAEAVANSVEGSQIPVIDCLGSLNDNSLIRQRDTDGDGDLDLRFFMLQTIREFGREQLEASGERPAVKDAHAKFFLELALEAEPHLTGPAAVTWLDRLDADHGNLRSALAWLREQGDADRAVQLAAALWRFWWLRGHVGEGRDQLESTLVIAESGTSTPARAVALDGAGILAETQADYARAQSLHEEALAVSRGLEDAAGTARALENLGVVAFDQGDADRAEKLLEESLTLARKLGDDQLTATALNDLGRVAFARGDLKRAETLYRESLALRRRLGSGPEMARSLNNLGGVALWMEDFAQARRLFSESLDLYREAGDKWGAAGALNGLAVALRNEGNTEDAQILLEESLSLFQETGDVRNASLALLNLADTARESGDLDQAADRYREVLTQLDHFGERAEVVDALAGLGGILATEGRAETAARLLGAVSAVRQGGAASDALTDSARFDADVAAVRAELSPEAFATAWEAGRKLSLAAAIDEATASPSLSYR